MPYPHPFFQRGAVSYMPQTSHQDSPGQKAQAPDRCMICESTFHSVQKCPEIKKRAVTPLGTRRPAGQEKEVEEQESPPSSEESQDGDAQKVTPQSRLHVQKICSEETDYFIVQMN